MPSDDSGPEAALRANRLRIGECTVDPATHEITREGRTSRLDARVLRLLTYLAARAGQTVTTDELMERLWPDTVVTQDSIYQAVATLRRALGDDPKQPTYIVTVPKRGYRLIAKVDSESLRTPVGPAQAQSGFRKLWIAAAAAVLLTILGVLVLLHRTGSTAIAVHPFEDLTSQAMNEEYFADGITEEMIHQLSNTPGTEVTTEAKADYVLTGSVRRSGETLRISVRLTRARDGTVVESETYERSSKDLLSVQKDVAQDVAKKFRAQRESRHAR